MSGEILALVARIALRQVARRIAHQVINLASLTIIVVGQNKKEPVRRKEIRCLGISTEKPGVEVPIADGLGAGQAQLADIDGLIPVVVDFDPIRGKGLDFTLLVLVGKNNFIVLWLVLAHL